MTFGLSTEPYTRAIRDWLQGTTHYLGRAPVGAYLAVCVRELEPGLWSEVPVGRLLGVAVIGRPIARRLPQDGTAAEVLRLWLDPSLPHGTASMVLRYAGEAAAARGVLALYAYHDRRHHTGCIYRKAGFTRQHATAPRADAGWGTRGGRAPTEAGSRRRWMLDLA